MVMLVAQRYGTHGTTFVIMNLSKFTQQVSRAWPAIPSHEAAREPKARDGGPVHPSPMDLLARAGGVRGTGATGGGHDRQNDGGGHDGGAFGPHMLDASSRMHRPPSPASLWCRCAIRPNLRAGFPRDGVVTQRAGISPRPEEGWPGRRSCLRSATGVLGCGETVRR